MSSDQARLVAERIARRVGTSAPEVRGPVETDLSSELAAVRATLKDRFGVEEATVSELVDFFQNEKACSLEPGGKPCDHCAMCSSRGF